MDQTLGQILTLLFQLQLQVQNLTAERDQLKRVIDSNLPVHNGSMADLQNAEVISQKTA